MMPPQRSFNENIFFLIVSSFEFKFEHVGTLNIQINILLLVIFYLIIIVFHVSDL